MRDNLLSRQSSRLSLALAGLVLAAGCSRTPDGPQFVRATGLVTYKGEPLKSGQISFIPDSAHGTSGPMASGNINEQGEFELFSKKPGDGAVVGFHKVAIRCSKVSGIDPNNPSAPIEVSLIPVHYADGNSSQLVAEVKSDPELNIYKFELTP